MTQVELHFFGAAGTVTGSKFLLETSEMNILIDCGMFQGLKELRLQNWDVFPFPPEKIDLVLLTHGHFDHVGYLPKLRQQGFEGPIIGSSPTMAVASVVLLDSAKIQEEDAERANEEGYSKHHPAKPFYTVEDAERVISYFKTEEPDKWIKISENISCRFRKNGHIIGATFIELDVFGKRFVFSGDIGRKQDVLLDPPQKPEWADFLIMESTYGDKLHPNEDADEVLQKTIMDTLEKRGTLIIPSFAVERLQTLMVSLWRLYHAKKIPNIPVFIDSPMGNRVLSIFAQYPEWHKLSKTEMSAMQRHFNIISSYAETWKTIDNPRPKVVIAGSGMVTGGRVLTYLKYYIDKPETTVLLVGFQAEGTRGRMLLEGAKELKIQGKYYSVKATVKDIQSLSAHADQHGLLEWTDSIKNFPENVFLVHGEPEALQELSKKLSEKNWKVTIPDLQDKITLSRK